MIPIIRHIIQIAIILFILPVHGQNIPEHNLFKGVASFHKQLYDSAIYYLTRAEKEMEAFPETYVIHGQALHAIGQRQLAIQSFTKAEQKAKGSGSYWLAKTYAELGDPVKSLEYLNANFNSNYRVPESKILLDNDFLKFENHDDWKDFWRNSVRYTTIEAILFEADYNLRTGNHTDALVIIDDALKRGLMRGPLHSKRADIYLAMNNHRMAANDLNTAIQSDRRNPSLYSKRAYAQMKLGRYKQALADYEQAIRFAPLEFNVYRERAEAYLETGQYELAVEDMNFYLSYFPENDEAWYQAGMIHFKNERYLNSLQAFNKALELNRNKAAYYTARGEAYLQTRTYRYAWNDFSMALDLNPVNPRVYLNKGIAAVHIGNLKDACYSFEMARRQGVLEAEEYIRRHCEGR
jgi:tetratricopeptide (TPR) repeat protein